MTHARRDVDGRRLSRSFCVSVASSLLALACTRSTAPPVAAADAVLFRIEPMSGSSGVRRVWIATHEHDGQAARFRIELELREPKGEIPIAFTSGAFVRQPGSEGTRLMQDLAQALGARRPPVPDNGVTRLEFAAVILGRNLSRGRGDDQSAGAYTSHPAGTWIATKLFLGDEQGEVFLNLDPVGGWGEFAAKDREHAGDVLRELGRVLLGEAVSTSNRGLASGPVTPSPPPGNTVLESSLETLRNPESPELRRMYAINALARLGAEGRLAVPDVIAEIEDPSWLVRYAALAALPRLGGDPAELREAITPSLRHEHGPTRVAAARALWKLGEPELAVQHLTAFLEDERSRAEAATVLGEVGSEARGAVPQLVRVLETRRNADEGWRVCHALGEIGPAARDAVPALQEALNDPSPHVSGAARAALTEIEER